MEVPEHAQAQSLPMVMETVRACSPKTLPVPREGLLWGDGRPRSPLPGLFRVELLRSVEFAGFCLLSFWAHPPRLAPSPTSVPSSSHPLPPPRAFPSCYLTPVLNIVIIKICCQIRRRCALPRPQLAEPSPFI